MILEKNAGSGSLCLNKNRVRVSFLPVQGSLGGSAISFSWLATTLQKLKVTPALAHVENNKVIDVCYITMLRAYV